jgi:ribosomal protein L40E
MHVRVCRDCGEEFRPEVTVCSDCGGVLEDKNLEEEEAWNPAPGVIPSPQPSVAPPGQHRAIHQASSAAEIEPLAKALGAAHIPFAVTGSFQAFSLLVAHEDAERAFEALRPFGLVTDAPAEGPSVCPACGAALGPSAAECPDCGLGLAAADEIAPPRSEG